VKGEKRSEDIGEEGRREEIKEKVR